jgi:hypothetical protein
MAFLFAAALTPALALAQKVVVTPRRGQFAAG